MSYPWLSLERREDPNRALITLAVRMKLDLAGLKIGLHDWRTLSDDQRTTLHDTRVDSESDSIQRFTVLLTAMLSHAGRSPPRTLPGRDAGLEWIDPHRVPNVVSETARRANVDISWSDTTLFARYVLHHFAAKDSPILFVQAVAELQGRDLQQDRS